jgi:hypothetical protein
VSSGSVTVDLNSDPYTREGIVKVTAVTDTKHATVDVITPLASTAASADWSEGSWSDENGYPAAITFYQDRLCFARTYAEPQAEWASKTSAYADFGRSATLQDTDGISINLPSYKVNGINSLVALADIIAMTSATEWSIGPGSDGIFTPTSVQTRCHGYRGSSNLAPVIVGNRIIYVLPSGSTVRDFGYDYNVNGYTGDNLSLLANHMLEGKSVVSMAYQQDPDSIVWMVRSDGVMLSLTYLREQEVVAWARHVTDGEIESACCIPGDGHDELWLSVKRGEKRFIERMERRTISTDPREQYFVDCGLTYRGEPTTVITGLDHLEGKDVAILANGSVEVQQTVTDGSITLNAEASIVHVGLPYQSDLETLNLELSLKDGTMQGMKVKISDGVLRFLNSRGGHAGTDEGDLVEVSQRTSEAPGTPIELFTGDYETSISSDYRSGARVFIRQSDPLPMTLLAIISHIDIGG